MNNEVKIASIYARFSGDDTPTTEEMLPYLMLAEEYGSSVATASIIQNGIYGDILFNDGSTTSSKITLVFQELFGREPLQDGLKYWVDQFENNSSYVNATSLAEAVLRGAQANEDQTDWNHVESYASVHKMELSSYLATKKTNSDSVNQVDNVTESSSEEINVEISTDNQIFSQKTYFETEEYHTEEIYEHSDHDDNDDYDHYDDNHDQNYQNILVSSNISEIIVNDTQLSLINDQYLNIKNDLLNNNQLDIGSIIALDNQIESLEDYYEYNYGFELDDYFEAQYGFELDDIYNNQKTYFKTEEYYTEEIYEHSDHDDNDDYDHYDDNHDQNYQNILVSSNISEIIANDTQLSLINDQYLNIKNDLLNNNQLDIGSIIALDNQIESLEDYYEYNYGFELDDYFEAQYGFELDDIYEDGYFS